MMKIYVGNLPFKATEPDLRSVFQQFGDIQEVAMITDRYTNAFKGFGFITYTSQEGAQAALSMDGKEFMGRPMKVNIAREPEKRTGGGGRRFNDRRSGGRDEGDRGGRW